jgi:hypothetical protein
VKIPTIVIVYRRGKIERVEQNLAPEVEVLVVDEGSQLGVLSISSSEVEVFASSHDEEGVAQTRARLVERGAL